VRALVVVDAGEGIEARLLLQEVFSGRLGGFLLQGQMHTFVPAVLLGCAGLMRSMAIPRRSHPHGQFAQAEEGAVAGEGHTVCRCGWRAQAVVLEVLSKTLKAKCSRVLCRPSQHSR